MAKKKEGLNLEDGNMVENNAPAYSPQPIGDYSTPWSKGYNDYPGAGGRWGENGGTGPRPAYQGPAPEGGSSDALGAAGTGAAAGAAGGPWGAIIGAAAGLITSVMQQKAAEKAQKLKYQIDQQEAAQARLAQAQNRQVATVGDMGQRSSNAYQQLLGVLARSVR